MEDGEIDMRYFFEEDDDIYSTKFSVLSESDIKHLQNIDINRLLSVLSITRPIACLLLTHYNWNILQVFDSWFDNQQKVRKTLGLSNKPHHQIVELGFPNSEETTHTCGICFDTFSTDEIKSSWCGHPFCISCWNQYVDLNIDDLNCFKLKCPQPSCNAAVDEDIIQQLASKSRMIKYDQFLFRSYVENNNNMKLKWCPAPNCCYAICYELAYHDSSSSRINYDVTCHCYHSFCWNCGEDAHAPLNCETVAEWMKKINSEFKITTTGWIIANTKPCPNCKIPIEKNNGCNHMTCKCGFQFCWSCLRDPSTCRSSACCNISNEVEFEVFEDEMQRNHPKNQLDRYTYYHQGWANNEIARKKALQNLIEMSTLHHKRPSSLTRKMAENYFYYINDALRHIVECRRILKWSFVYGYYLSENENAKIEFFDHVIDTAQFVLDRLHYFAENELRKALNDGSEEEFHDSRLKLITLTRVTKSYFMNLVNEMENDHDIVHVKNYTGVKSESREIGENSLRRLNTRRLRM